MTDTLTTAQIPKLWADQQGKEFTVNEAMVQIGTFFAGVLSASVTEPPADPVDGDAYVVPEGATGAWSGMGQKLAIYFSGYRYIDPFPGLMIRVADEGQWWTYTEGSPGSWGPYNPGAGVIGPGTSTPGNIAAFSNGSGDALSDGGVAVTDVAALFGLLSAADQGDILYRSASGWARLAPGTAKYVLRTGGASADPAWALPLQCIPIACSDETTALTAGSGKVTFRMPYAFKLTDIRASLTTAQTGSGGGGILTVDVNEAGSTILSTKLTIDNAEKTSTTAATPVVVSDADLADDAEITIDIDQIGDGTAKGLKVYLMGYPV